MNLLTTTLAIGLFFSTVLAALTSFHPVVLMTIGGAMLRVSALWAVAQNWLAIFDGFMTSVVSLGLLIGNGAITTEEMLSPGYILLQGLRVSTNFYLILLNMADDIWYAPLLFVVYTGVWVILIAVSGFLALALMAAKVEFQYISVFAFLMWPLMPITFTAWIADNLVRLLVAAALRLGGLAALYSIVLPFVVSLGVPGAEEPTVQSAISMGIGIAALGYFIWQGPRMLGASAWPGSGLVTLGMLTWVGLRSRG